MGMPGSAACIVTDKHYIVIVLRFINHPVSDKGIDHITVKFSGFNEIGFHASIVIVCFRKLK